MQFASHVKRAETEETNGKGSWPTVIYCIRSPILVTIWPPNTGVLSTNKSEFRNDILTECISRHILYEQYPKSLHEKKVMFSTIANNYYNYDAVRKAHCGAI